MFNKLFAEFIDIIEWTDKDNQTLVHRFERYNNEIKNGAQLVVRPGQLAVLVSEGQLGDTYQPGTHRLTTSNMPITTTLSSWKYGFESPFKVEVYFFSTRIFSNLKWGTATPVIKRDAELGVVRLRARGQFSIQVIGTPSKLLTDFVGTKPNFTMDDIFDYLRSNVVMAFADMVASDNISLYDLATKYQDYTIKLQELAQELFGKTGFGVPLLTIDAITVPEEVEALIDKRSGMGIMGQPNFITFQAGLSMTDGQGGNSLAADAVGLGMGLNLANQVMAGQTRAASAPGAMPPPLPQTGEPFYWAAGQTQNGPNSMAELTALIQNQTIKADTLLWQKGMAAWTPASQVPALSHLFGQTPPPIPA
jgi:membrane protease subunit (stomatin/prohibitin family)